MSSIRKREWTTRKGERRKAFIVDYKAWSHQRGKWERKHKTFAREKDAVAWRDDNASDIKSKVYVADRDSPTVREAAEDWIKAVASGRDERGPAEACTLRQYNYLKDTYILPSRIGEMKICDLTQADVKAWRHDLLARVSRSLARKVLGALKSILSEAISNEKATINVAAKVKIGLPNEQKVIVPEMAEIKAILATADRLAVPGPEGRAWRSYRGMVSLAVHTGMRIGEIRGVPWTALDLVAGKVHVRQVADENNNIKPYPKSDAGIRTIHLPADLVRLLREWKIEAGGNALVFATETGRPHSASNILRRGWFPLQELAGICDTVTDENGNVLRDEDGRPKVEARHNFHRLRHFHASMLIADGANPLEVSKEMGHKDVAFTLRVYGHLFQDEEANRRRQERSERLATSLGR